MKTTNNNDKARAAMTMIAVVLSAGCGSPASASLVTGSMFASNLRGTGTKIAQ